MQLQERMCIVKGGGLQLMFSWVCLCPGHFNDDLILLAVHAQMPFCH